MTVGSPFDFGSQCQGQPRYFWARYKLILCNHFQIPHIRGLFDKYVDNRDKSKTRRLFLLKFINVFIEGLTHRKVQVILD